MEGENWDHQRQEMVSQQLLSRGIADSLVLDAMSRVPRHCFVPSKQRRFAYKDGPLAIGEGQTISQPFIVAQMTELAQLKPGDRVLEVGTGSGYGSAVLREIVDEVWTIERIPDLATQAKANWDEAGTLPVHMVVGDGSVGCDEAAPYDAILVTASSPSIPPSLVKQLKIGGRLVIPVGDHGSQQLLRGIKREGGEFQVEVLEPVRFVPLIGDEGWNDL